MAYKTKKIILLIEFINKNFIFWKSLKRKVKSWLYYKLFQNNLFKNIL